ncbi:MAG: 50S ribosomal protein L29 [Clostridia bacterium]|nr:50S ribosomal protein L29 [Clostridia bacterium]
MNKKDYKELSVNELKAQEAKLRSELFNLTFQKYSNQLSNPVQIREIKKDIARVKTYLRLKELEGKKV